jgi:hypothetical protein
LEWQVSLLLPLLKPRLAASTMFSTRARPLDTSLFVNSTVAQSKETIVANNGRYLELMALAQSDYMSQAEFEELLAIVKKKVTK